MTMGGRIGLGGWLDFLTQRRGGRGVNAEFF